MGRLDWLRISAASWRTLLVSSAASRACRIGAASVSRHARSQNESQNRSCPGPSARLKILMADDDPAILELNETLVEREGHEVVAVESGADALRVLSKQRFDVIFLDEEMPGMSGVDVLKKIRAGEPADAKRQIVFALSGNSADEDRARLLAAGFDACFSKPFRPEELHQTAARFSLGAPAPGATKASASASPRPPIPLFSRASAATQSCCETSREHSCGTIRRSLPQSSRPLLARTPPRSPPPPTR